MQWWQVSDQLRTTCDPSQHSAAARAACSSNLARGVVAGLSHVHMFALHAHRLLCVPLCCWLGRAHHLHLQMLTGKALSCAVTVALAVWAFPAAAAGQNGKDKASTVDHSDLDDDSAEEDNWVEDLLDEEAAEAKAAKGPKSPAVNGSGGATSPAGDRAATPPGKKKGKPQVQNPKRVRPWPAGPPAPDPNRPASATAEEREQGQQSTVKVDHQVSLASVLSAFGIKFGKLHNAGEPVQMLGGAMAFQHTHCQHTRCWLGGRQTRPGRVAAKQTSPHAC